MSSQGLNHDLGRPWISDSSSATWNVTMCAMTGFLKRVETT